MSSDSTPAASAPVAAPEVKKEEEKKEEKKADVPEATINELFVHARSAGALSDALRAFIAKSKPEDLSAAGFAGDETLAIVAKTGSFLIKKGDPPVLTKEDKLEKVEKERKSGLLEFKFKKRSELKDGGNPVTALHMAAKASSLPVLKALLEAGCSPTATLPVSVVCENADDSANWAAVEVSATVAAEGAAVGMITQWAEMYTTYAEAMKAIRSECDAVTLAYFGKANGLQEVETKNADLVTTSEGWVFRSGVSPAAAAWPPAMHEMMGLFFIKSLEAEATAWRAEEAKQRPEEQKKKDEWDSKIEKAKDTAEKKQLQEDRKKAEEEDKKKKEEKNKSRPRPFQFLPLASVEIKKDLFVKSKVTCTFAAACNGKKEVIDRLLHRNIDQFQRLSVPVLQNKGLAATETLQVTAFDVAEMNGYDDIAEMFNRSCRACGSGDCSMM